MTYLIQVYRKQKGFPFENSIDNAFENTVQAKVAKGSVKAPKATKYFCIRDYDLEPTLWVWLNSSLMVIWTKLFD